MDREVSGDPGTASIYASPDTGGQPVALKQLEDLEDVDVEQAVSSNDSASASSLSDVAVSAANGHMLLASGTAESAVTRQVGLAPKGGWLGFVLRPRVLLSAVIVMQAVLSLRLIWSDTAFPDEALYLWAGHLEWAHWLHGAPLPAFSTFFSGAPVVYPPVGAIADSLGGLAGARLLSLCFMLVVTLVLYGVTRRLFSERAAVFAAAIFASLSPTQYLGAFATYDAMALMFVTVAAWLGVCAAGSTPALRVPYTMSAAAALVLSDATKYAAALFTPVVVLMVIMTAWWRSGRRAAVQISLIMIVCCGALMAFALRLGGHSYWQGIASTTLARAHGSYSRSFLLFISAKWEGTIVVLALIGAAAVITTWHRERPAVVLACLLACTPFLVPIEQARIETYTSLFKHVGYGAWFGAILGGYCLEAFRGAVAPSKVAHSVRVGWAVVALIAIPQIPWATSHYGWPETAAMMPVMERVIESTNGPLLADDRGNILDYYLPRKLGNREIYGTDFFAFNDPVSGRHLTQAAAYAAAVKERYFSVIFLEFWDAAPVDNVVRADIRRYGGYRTDSVIPYRATGIHGEAVIWVRAGGRK